LEKCAQRAETAINKTASRNQLRRARDAAKKRRPGPRYRSPSAGKYGEALNNLPKEFFGKPRKVLSREELRRLSVTVAEFEGFGRPLNKHDDSAHSAFDPGGSFAEHVQMARSVLGKS
jgi:hypothetical protein